MSQESLPTCYANISQYTTPEHEGPFWSVLFRLSTKSFMLNLTSNILSRKCSDERKFGTRTLQYQDSKSSENGGYSWFGCRGNRCFVMKRS